MLARVKVGTTHEADDIEAKVNSCLADVGSDASNVVDVIRKAITNDDDTKYVDGQFLLIYCRNALVDARFHRHLRPFHFAICRQTPTLCPVFC